MRRTKIDASGFLLAAMAALLVAGGVSVYFAVRSDPIQEALSGDRIINTLFVVEREGTPLSSFVVMYYPATNRAALFDVPGEIGLIISSLERVDRIDALYNPKKTAPYAKEISNLLGVDIPFRVVLDLDSLERLVDLLDGVDLFIADSVEVFDNDPPVLLPSGSVKLDGYKARLYAMYELPDEVQSEVVARRQRLILALIKRLGERNSYLKSSPVWPRFQSFARTNMDKHTFQRLLDELAGIDTDRVSVQRVGGNVKEVSGQSLLFPYYDGSLIKDIVKQSLASLTRTGDGGSADRVYTVEVLNGTMTTGLARKTAELLQGFGYDTIIISNADRSDYDQTEIIDRSGDSDAANVFAGVIRCKSISTEQRVVGDGLSPDTKADFTIIIGKDFNGRYVIR